MLNKYEVFVQVAETRNLTKVAERYHYSQSAISHALRALEEEIGLPLVHRAKNGITLTKYGEELLPDFRRIVCSRERLLQKAARHTACRSLYECIDALDSGRCRKVRSGIPQHPADSISQQL